MPRIKELMDAISDGPASNELESLSFDGILRFLKDIMVADILKFLKPEMKAAQESSKEASDKIRDDVLRAVDEQAVALKQAINEMSNKTESMIKTSATNDTASKNHAEVLKLISQQTELLKKIMTYCSDKTSPEYDITPERDGSKFVTKYKLRLVNERKMH
jgi:hypothetical protein